MGDIERSTRTVKEHTQCHIHHLPYKRYPIEMVCGCVIKLVKELNCVVSNNGVSKDLTPGTLVTGVPGPSYKEIMKLNFGDYMHAHLSAETTNTNEPRTTGYIALYPANGAQDSWYFMSLVTGKRIHRYQWTVLLISKEVLARVNTIAIREKQPLVASNFKYQWSLMVTRLA